MSGMSVQGQQQSYTPYLDKLADISKGRLFYEEVFLHLSSKDWIALSQTSGSWKDRVKNLNLEFFKDTILGMLKDHRIYLDKFKFIGLLKVLYQLFPKEFSQELEYQECLWLLGDVIALEDPKEAVRIYKEFAENATVPDQAFMAKKIAKIDPGEGIKFAKDISDDSSWSQKTTAQLEESSNQEIEREMGFNPNASDDVLKNREKKLNYFIDDANRLIEQDQFEEAEKVLNEMEKFFYQTIRTDTGKVYDSRFFQVYFWIYELKLCRGFCWIQNKEGAERIYEKFQKIKKTQVLKTQQDIEGTIFFKATITHFLGCLDADELNELKSLLFKHVNVLSIPIEWLVALPDPFFQDLDWVKAIVDKADGPIFFENQLKLCMYLRALEVNLRSSQVAQAALDPNNPA